MAIAAEIPDLDIFTQVGGSVFGFQHHRGFTHSFVGLPLDAAGALLIVWGIHRLRGRWRERQGKPAPQVAPRWGLLFIFGLIASASHILLDFTNQYGVRPFIPFSYRWYHWDIVSIVEPVLTLALLLGLIMPTLFALIQEEIGAKRTHGRGGAVVALLLVALIWGVRDYEHRRALAAVSALEYGEQLPLRISAFPYMTNPFQWYAIVETESAFHQMDVDSLTPEVDPRRRARIHYKQPDTPVTEAAKKSYLGRVYLDWADYPILEVQKLAPGEDIGEGRLERLTWQGVPGGNGGDDEPSPGGYLVRLIDLRYAYPDRPRVLRAAVQLDANDNVVAFYFGLRREKAN